MTAFYIALTTWMGAVASWAFFFQPYAELRPIDRIERGYLRWNENWDINHRRRTYYHLIGLWRYWFKPLRSDKGRLFRTRRAMRDHEQLDPHKYHIIKNKGQLF